MPLSVLHCCQYLLEMFTILQKDAKQNNINFHFINKTAFLKIKVTSKKEQ